MISSVNPIFRVLFNEVTPVIAGTNFIQENSIERISQLAVNYRQSPLSEDHGMHGGVHAGNRVPDVIVRLLASSQSEHSGHLSGAVHLFKLLNPSFFTLLILADSSQSQAVSRMEKLFHDWAGAKQHPFVQILQVAASGEGDAQSLGKIFVGKSDSETPLLYFIRPDGYIGFRGQLEHLDRLQAYWARWFRRDVSAQVAA
jgi:hypothetical protein